MQMREGSAAGSLLFSTLLTPAQRRAEVNWDLPGAKAGPKASPKMQSVLLPQTMANKGFY